MLHIVTLHCFVLHGSDVLKTRWRNIPVFLHLLLLLTVGGAAVSNEKYTHTHIYVYYTHTHKVFSLKTTTNKLINIFISFWVFDLINQSFVCLQLKRSVTGVQLLLHTNIATHYTN